MNLRMYTQRDGRITQWGVASEAEYNTLVSCICIIQNQTNDIIPTRTQLINSNTKEVLLEHYVSLGAASPTVDD
jgi:hypothetical protein